MLVGPMSPTDANLTLAALWGLAEADPWVLGGVIALLLVAAMAYGVGRLRRGR